MLPTYSTYEAKAKFSEIMRRVRAGERVVITYQGREVAEIGPIAQREPGLEAWLSSLERRGVVQPPGRERTGPIRPIARRPGALRRFLESRE